MQLQTLKKKKNPRDLNPEPSGDKCFNFWAEDMLADKHSGME